MIQSFFILLFCFSYIKAETPYYEEKNKIQTKVLFSPCTFPRNPASTSNNPNVIFDMNNEVSLYLLLLLLV